MESTGKSTFTLDTQMECWYSSHRQTANGKGGSRSCKAIIVAQHCRSALLWICLTVTSVLFVSSSVAVNLQDAVVGGWLFDEGTGKTVKAN
ncbi:hypothetical protein IH992_19180 [Candidatus Poribacteria bacterium]|nr:hypothetical protein [Candidatus Poribacteria bacterium]